MTRKEFLNNMIQTILGYSIIKLKKIDNDKVVYIKYGTLVKDCSYTQRYHDKVVELICYIFDKNVKKIQIETENKPIEAYQNNARNFLNNIIQDNSVEKTVDDSYGLFRLSLEELNYIYRFIIIYEIFHVEEDGEECGNDDFNDSVNKIIKDIYEYLHKIPKREWHYNSKRQAFLNAIDNPDLYALQSEFEIFYKSSELGKRYANIKEYLEIKKYDFVILNNSSVTDFKPNTVYRYTGECFFEVGERSEIITYFIYNN